MIRNQMDLHRSRIRLGLAGLAVVIVAAVFVMRGGRGGNGGFAGGSAQRGGSVSALSGPDEGAERKGADRRAAEAKRAPDLSGSEATQAFAIYDGSRQYLKDLELKRASLFSQYKDAEGNSSSTMLLERPSAEELDVIFEDYLKSLPAGDRKFVEQTGLSTNLKKDIEDFFGYGDKYRYVTFLLAGDGSEPLPSVLIFESDKLYDRKEASGGGLDIPAEELRLKEFADLKVGDPKLERYGRLFSVK